jgi:hypothetical protein
MCCRNLLCPLKSLHSGSSWWHVSPITASRFDRRRWQYRITNQRILVLRCGHGNRYRQSSRPTNVKSSTSRTQTGHTNISFLQVARFRACGSSQLYTSIHYQTGVLQPFVSLWKSGNQLEMHTHSLVDETQFALLGIEHASRACGGHFTTNRIEPQG